MCKYKVLDYIYKVKLQGSKVNQAVSRMSLRFQSIPLIINDLTEVLLDKCKSSILLTRSRSGHHRRITSLVKIQRSKTRNDT